jgi:hypothetical protein
MKTTENNPMDLKQRLTDIFNQVEESAEHGCGCGGGCGCDEAETDEAASCNCDCEDNSSCCKN